jgi:hypothetical protein
LRNNRKEPIKGKYWKRKTTLIQKIQFNSINIYLCANLRAQRPITKSAQVKKKKKYTYKENTKERQLI